MVAGSSRHLEVTGEYDDHKRSVSAEIATVNSDTQSTKNAKPRSWARMIDRWILPIETSLALGSPLRD
jgi:hypothetical protein